MPFLRSVCNKVFLTQDFLDILYIYLRKSLEIQASVIFSYILFFLSKIGYNLDILRQTAFRVYNPITVEGFAALFSCAAVVLA